MAGGRTRLFFRYLNYQLHARTRHGVHSPFVFDFIEKVLRDKTPYPEYRPIEELRKRLLKDKREIEVKDFGAGSSVGSGRIRKVSRIVAISVKPAKYGQLLFRMARYFQAIEILEIGTSLGLSTAYLASANPAAKVTTLEGSLDISSIAVQNWKDLRLENVEMIQGEFDTTLTDALNQFAQLDLVFIDGNHRRDPTIGYFNECLGKSGENTIIVLDDIHWSSEMEEAWKQIIRNPAVTLSIDLFFMGMVCLKKEIKYPQHIILRH